MTGGDVICRAILEAGVHTVFGYPGGAIMPFYDALLRHPLRHVLVRHEAAAGFAADGYARALGGLGVCVTTSGPGATNLVSAIACAYMDSVPVVAITGQVTSSLIGTDAFQETDVTGVFLPVTKWTTLVRRPADLGDALWRAFDIATSGRPGPVVIDVCKDVLSSDASARLARVATPSPERSLVVPAADLVAIERQLAVAKRPLILAGRGVRLARAEPELLQLAQAWNAPVATTLLGIGALSEDHPLSLGMMGMHGGMHANRAIAEADFVLAVGMRFDDRVTGRLDRYLRNAYVVHIDIDEAEVGKNVSPDVAIVADARQALRVLLTIKTRAKGDMEAMKLERDGRRSLLDRLRGGPFVAPQALALLDGVAADDAIIVTDVGQHQMWEAQHVTHGNSRTLLTSGGAGTMAYALGAAIGAKLAQPHREVWAVMGDGGFQMASPELATLVQEELPIRVLVLNNGRLGMVRQWQQLFHEGRYSSTSLSGPDIVALAAAHGVPGWRATDVDGARAGLENAKRTNGPAIIDCRILADDNVYPMIAPGRGLDEMLIAVNE